MKILIYLLATCINIGCQPTEVDNKTNGRDTSKLVAKEGTEPLHVTAPENQRGLAEFETLVRNEYDIPSTYIHEFVTGIDSALLKQGNKFVGKSVIHSGSHKIFYIKQGNEREGNVLLICYDKTDRQLDFKALKNYCHSCPDTSYNCEIVFPGKLEGFLFKVEYYNQESTKEMPDLDKVRILKSEKWTVGHNGRFLIVK